MEESVNDAHRSFQSPPRRRRSTFFERRESIVPQITPENLNPKICQINPVEDDKHSRQLSSYYDKLLHEKEQWKKEVKSRRNKYHDLRQQYQMAVESSSKSTLSFSSLSNEDIEFVRGKVNISKIIDCQQKLHKSLKVTKALYERACELENVVIKHCEDRVNRITDYILDHSTIESAE